MDNAQGEPAPGRAADRQAPAFAAREREEIQRRLRIRPALIYEIVSEEGEEELARSFPALWWSGLAAGLSIGFSMVAAGVLETGLPDTAWAQAVIAVGYTAGFLIVILGRQQLFTENTITALLPVMSPRTGPHFPAMLRLWGIVFAANMVGAAVFTLGIVVMDLAAPAYQETFQNMGAHFIEMPTVTLFGRAIIGGWLVAAMVWALPSSPNERFWIILFFTWLVGLGDFAHIVAGSVETLFAVVTGPFGAIDLVFRFMLPTLIGNIVGGSALFALITYAQVKEEVYGKD
ncbi:MAG: formate/nitrite transporter family protein [Rhodothalassiaceae bacterium]